MIRRKWPKEKMIKKGMSIRIIFAVSFEKIIFANNIRIMIGQKHIPQTISGKQADQIVKTLPSKNHTQKPKGRAPLPDKMTVSWK